MQGLPKNIVQKLEKIWITQKKHIVNKKENHILIARITAILVSFWKTFI